VDTTNPNEWIAYEPVRKDPRSLKGIMLSISVSGQSTLTAEALDVLGWPDRVQALFNPFSASLGLRRSQRTDRHTLKVTKLHEGLYAVSLTGVLKRFNIAAGQRTVGRVEGDMVVFPVITKED
jgi:hypothetical protein